MATGNDPIVEGFTGGIRLAWVVHLMLIQDGVAARDTVSSASSNEMSYLSQCLEAVFSNNVFQFLLEKVLRTAAFQVHLPCIFLWFFFLDKKLIGKAIFVITTLEFPEVKKGKIKSANAALHSLCISVHWVWNMLESPCVGVSYSSYDKL